MFVAEMFSVGVARVLLRLILQENERAHRVSNCSFCVETVLVGVVVAVYSLEI